MEPTHFLLPILLAGLLAAPALAEPVISEFMADNASTLADEDGAFSDWIEIYNPDATPAALGGWSLTDSATTPAKWQFPAVTVPPGGFLVVWASGKDRRVAGAPLHTNFSLAKSGEYLALVRPDGSAATAFAPEFPALGPDQAYGGRFQRTVLLADKATGRYRIPTSAGNPGSAWTQRTFTDSAWAAGPGGFGFGISVPGITVRQVLKNGEIGGLADALNLLSLPPTDPQVLSTHVVVQDVVNILGEGADGRYGQNNVPPAGSGFENFAISCTGTLTIPTAGYYTFGLNSDDGGQIKIDGSAIMNDDSFHGPQDHFGTVYLAAGPHTFEAIMFEGYAGDSIEFFAAPGYRTTFDASVFRLVGDVANGGLAATTTPLAAGGVIGTDLKSAMGSSPGAFIRLPFTSTGAGQATSLSLVMRYNDGFTAWLNGSQVVAANAPASPAWNATALAPRADGTILRRSAFDLSAQLPGLLSGTNVLAIQGVRTSGTDPSFLIAPELVMGRLDAAAGLAYYGNGLATPGWINGAPSSLGQVADTNFSVKRGFFTAPFSVAITCETPGATIRYTTDGSTPDETRGFTYTGPLTISSTTVLRARAVLADWTPTNVDTQTYLFLDDVLTQSSTGSPPPGWPSSSGTAQVLDFGMDPEIVYHGNPDVGGTATIKAALMALPSISLTTDLSNLFNIGGSLGIYSNPGRRGYAWERPASLEWIDPPDAAHPQGQGKFQVDAGLRIRGGFSRSLENPKHSFRMLFRSEYGDSKLRFPIFGRAGAEEFDKIDLRTSQNYSWSFDGDSRNTFLREEACRQAMLDMGQPGSHVRYFHLYLNGRYWGLYNFDERTEAEFSASYLGGQPEDYDVVKSEGDADFVAAATDGNIDAWRDLWNKSKAHRASPTNANYFRMMGLAADGVTPTADPVLLDPDNLIDYLLVTFWSGNLDGCVSQFLGNNRANNWYGSRRRVGNPREGFRFFVHDFEHTMFNVNEDRTGPFNSAAESDFRYSNPLFLHQDLLGNAEYRMRWADRVHRHLFEGGALTPTSWNNRINKLAATVDASIAAESARWGDAKRANPLTRLDWTAAQNSLLDYLPPRNNVVLQQLRSDGLYPALDAPVFAPAGGYQASGTEVAVAGPASASLLYMVDGSDPRAIGGAVRTGARTYLSSTSSEALVPWSAGGWKYRGDGVNLGTSWRLPQYPDQAWASGAAELGYGDGDEATVIPIVDVDSGTPGIQKAATCYFRRTFVVDKPSEITSLTLSVEYDDAFAVYLNGVRVAGNLPVDPAFDHYTGSPIEDTILTAAVPRSLLVSGENLVAVEVHQANSGSSDLSMNLSLTAARSTTTTPLVLQGTGRQVVRMRARSGSEWSALTEAVYQVGTTPPAPGSLVVSEIDYHPAAPNGEAEFLELFNPDSTATIDLGGATFTAGIDFTFPAGSTLAPGARLLLVRNLAAFEAVHGTGRPVAGVFANDTALSNGGEQLRLESPGGEVLLDFTYGTTFPWPLAADGGGRSLVLVDPAAPGDPLAWRLSAAAGGNPGTSDTLPLAAGQDLLEYAMAGARPAVDPVARTFTVTCRLGADAVVLSPEWSAGLAGWRGDSLELVSATPDQAGNITLVWRLDALPAERAFLRMRVTRKP